jgi:hypothetical protein
MEATVITIKRRKYFQDFIDPIVEGVSVKSGDKWHLLTIRKSKAKKAKFIKDVLSKHWNKELIKLGEKHYKTIEIL